MLLPSSGRILLKYALHTSDRVENTPAIFRRGVRELYSGLVQAELKILCPSSGWLVVKCIGYLQVRM